MNPKVMEYCVTDDPIDYPNYRWKLFARFKEDGVIGTETLARFKEMKFAQAVASVLNSQVNK